MLTNGLTSVTFRNLDYRQIINYCLECNIGAIEWGSDIHAPEGDVKNALKIKEECQKAGIKISSYGSYYKCGSYEDARAEFSKYLSVAKALGAPVIRIWVGEKNYEEADSEYIDKIIAEIKTMCDMAKKENIDIGCEFHGGSLCNTRQNALCVVKKVDCDNFGMYFQYDWNYTTEENCKTLEAFLPILKNVHVFNVNAYSGQIKRYRLSESGGIELWTALTDVLKQNDKDAFLLFEFLPETSLDCLKEEVAVLCDITKDKEV